MERVFAGLQRQELEEQLQQLDPERPVRVSLNSTMVKAHQDAMRAPSKGGTGRSVARAEA